MTAVSRTAGRSRLPTVVGDRHETTRRQRGVSRKELFVDVKRMHAAGRALGHIAAEIGIPPTPHESFILEDSDTIAAVNDRSKKGSRG